MLIPNPDLAIAVDELMRATDERDRVSRQLSALLDALDSGVIVIDDQGRIVSWNAGAARLFGSAAGTLEDWLWAGCGPEDAADRVPAPSRIHPALETLLDGRARDAVEVPLPGPDGWERRASVSTRAVRNMGGQHVESVVCTVRDLTPHRDLERQATIDPLTGAFNRRYLDMRLEAEVSRARRLRQPLALALADLDHFKRINDRYGHAGGDRALQSFVAVLRRSLRTEDVIVRLGGDEFCILLPSTPAQRAVGPLERVIASLRTTDIEAGGDVPFRVSSTFGVAGLEDGQAPTGLIAKADGALYAAKSAGRGCVRVRP